MKKNIIALLLICCNSIAYSQVKTDFGARGHIDFIKSYDKVLIGAHTEYRANNYLRSTDNWFVAVNGGYTPTKWLSTILQYEYWGYTNTHKIVPIITGTLKSGDLSVALREKYELAIDNKTTHTLRSRIRAAYNIKNTIFSPHISYEFFNSLEGRGWLRSYHIIGTILNFTEHHSLDVFYLYHLYRGEDSDTGCHIIGVGYNITF